MVSVLLDVRRARQRRTTLVALAVTGLALPLLAWALPAARPLLATPSAVGILLAGGSTLAACVAAVWSGREAHWALADDIAWTLSLTTFGVLAGATPSPLPASLALHVVALILLGVRVPPGRMIVAASLSTLLPILIRAALLRPSQELMGAALASSVALLAHVLLARATHSLAYVLAERETLLAERKGAATRARERREARERKEPREREESPVALLVPRAFRPASSALIEPKDDDGWEAVVERLRASVSALCEPAGVEASVHAELRGLAPPSSKMRQNVIKIAQEAASQALRDAAPRTLAITLRRADGGLLMEVLDDGAEGETVRTRRGLLAIRGRVAPMGGSAELRRADTGWMVRVKLPCEQLN